MNARAYILATTFFSGSGVYFCFFRGGSPYADVVAARESVAIFLLVGTGCALLKRCLFVFSVSWQPGNPFAKATVRCIGFFVRRLRQLLLVLSIILACLLLLCTLRTSSNLFVVVMHSSVRSTLSARTFVQLKCFVLPPFFFQSVVFPLQELALVMVSLSDDFVYFDVFVL